MRRSWLALAASLALVLGTAATAAATVTAGTSGAAATAERLAAGDAPPGFWWGTDSWPVKVPGSAPYSMPYLGGAYGGYIGMTGSWSYWLGCKGGFLAFSSANAAQAYTNYTKYHRGIGDGVYWFMGGPGVDPNWNGSSSEAYSWGARQAARALVDVASGHINYPVVWADIELPGVAPAHDNGWNSVYTSPCSGVVKQSSVPATVDRADFNGFSDYIRAHSSLKVGVYSSAPIWASIFGTGSAASIPNTYEWTYEPETAKFASAPTGWCLKAGGCAQFFGGQTSSSPYALMWQWSGGGGLSNGVGDFDQIDGARLG